MPLWFWILYFAFIGWLLISGYFLKRHSRRQWEHEKQYAHCNCGQRMSEWFKRDGCMWHPEFARGCGWISPWVDHEDFRESTKRETV